MAVELRLESVLVDRPHQLLELLMRGEDQLGRGHLVEVAHLQADDPVFDVIDDPDSVARADLARALGMTPFEIDDEGRAAYHAAASVASNFLVTLQAAAERIAAGAGLEPGDARQLLLPLLRRTIENVGELGPERALTGPVAEWLGARAQALMRQRFALDARAAALARLYSRVCRA